MKKSLSSSHCGPGSFIDSISVDYGECGTEESIDSIELRPPRDSNEGLTTLGDSNEVLTEEEVKRRMEELTKEDSNIGRKKEGRFGTKGMTPIPYDELERKIEESYNKNHNHRSLDVREHRHGEVTIIHSKKIQRFETTLEISSESSETKAIEKIKDLVSLCFIQKIKINDILQ